jgi:hypothetical protein
MAELPKDEPLVSSAFLLFILNIKQAFLPEILLGGGMI